ncbi:MAG TPA: protein kinase, partial [Vicinamibacteria bacterium]|nr:protein kinase [Vicinamibacteria bacterium]
KLGAGGMAAVYRARHLAFGEVRAIKVVGSRLADDEEFLRRFRNEAVVARRLQHPNAVRVDDLDMTEDGRPFIVMEYVEGENLREVIRREGALGIRRSVRIARQVASALGAAHALGIVHRDIKPDNVILAGRGDEETAKVLDFGIAKIKEGALGDSGAVATRTGMVVGTPQYISPEQAMGRRGSELDGRADLYSLGVVLYEMVTGRLPFESDTAMGLILHHLQTAPPAPEVLRPDLGIPEPLSAVLLRALEKDPERRFASALQMAAAFDDVLALALPDPPPGAAFRPPVVARRATPHPIPADIDRHETRVMPKTPASATRAAAPMVARGTPPPLPTPVPAPTVVTGSDRAGRAGQTPLPVPPLLPPPLPPSLTPPLLAGSAAPGAPPPRSRTWRRWWPWVAAAGLVWIFVTRDDPRPRERRSPRPPPPASGELGGEARALDDDRIAAEVHTALRASPRTRRHEIDVEVDEGIVMLTGDAPAPAATEAERLARAVPGVVEVVNALTPAEPGHAPHVGPSGLTGVPPVAPAPPALPPGLFPGGDSEKVKELLREGQKALKEGEPGKAMGIFGAAIALDPMSQEARRGFREAGRLFEVQQRGRVGGRRGPKTVPSP